MGMAFQRCAVHQQEVDERRMAGVRGQQESSVTMHIPPIQLSAIFYEK